MKGLLILCVLASGSLGLLAQNAIRFDSGVDKTTVQVGEAVHFNFGVEGADQMEVPSWPSDADFSVEYAGGSPRNSTMSYSINGKTRTEVRKSWVGSFTLRPKRTGVFTIPARSFRCQGQEFRSAPVRLTVTAAKKNADFILRWTPHATVLVAGQPLRLSLEFLYAAPVKALSLAFPFMDNPDFSWDPSQAPASGTADIVAFDVGGKQFYGRKAVVSHNGRQFNAVQISLTGHPTRNGRLELAGFAADIAGKTGSQTVRDFFDQLVEQDQYEDFSLVADPLQVEVKPLPLQGQPAGFGGLVGQLEIKAELGTARATLGEPLDLRILFKGLQNELDPQAEIESQLTLASRLKVSLKDRQTASDGSRAYTFLVRFTQAGSQAIEPLVLDYFEPKSGQYRLARSERLAVDVAAATLLGSGSVQGSWGQAPARRLDSPAVPDRALYPDSGLLAGLGQPFAPWLVPLVVLPAWGIGLWLGRPKRRRLREQRLRLRSLLALAEWDEASLAGLLPGEWTSWRQSFERLRYSPSGPERSTWLAELQEFCRQELHR